MISIFFNQLSNVLKLFSFLNLIFFPMISLAKPDNPKVYWENIGFNTRSILKNWEFLENDDCYKDDKKFGACFYTLDFVSKFINEEYSLVPFTLEFDKRISDGTLIKRWPDVVLVKKATVNKKLTPRLKSENRHKFLLAFNEEVSAFYRSSKAQQKQIIDFQKIYLELISDLEIKMNDSFKEYDAQLAVAIANAYLSYLIDPHTYVKTRQEVNDDLESGDTSTTGLGAFFKVTTSNQIKISKIIPKSSADLAHLEVNDIILKVGKTIVTAKEIRRSKKLFSAPAGTTLNFTIERNKKIFHVPVVFQTYVIENLIFKYLEDLQSKIAYFHLNSFSSLHDCEKVKSIIQTSEFKSSQGIIFDLRNNGGGATDVALCLSGLFVGPQTIFKSKNIQTNKIESHSSNEQKITDLPMVVLINGRSASSSEIFAGALQTYNRAWIVGERSYGKATMQNYLNFPSKNEKTKDLLIFTTSSLILQPNDRSHQIIGIKPSFEVYFTPDLTEDQTFVEREEQLYLNLQNSVSLPWIETRPNEVARINKCIETQRKALNKYENELALIRSENLENNIFPDFQIFTAQEILMCESIQ